MISVLDDAILAFVRDGDLLVIAPFADEPLSMALIKVGRACHPPWDARHVGREPPMGASTFCAAGLSHKGALRSPLLLDGASATLELVVDSALHFNQWSGPFLLVTPRWHSDGRRAVRHCYLGLFRSQSTQAWHRSTPPCHTCNAYKLHTWSH
jgi:hypothetical protein